MKLSFAYLSDEDILSISFDSNFPCKCQKKTIKNKNQQKYVFDLIFRQYDDDKENDITDYNGQQLGNLWLQPDFKYHQNHEFHKLSPSLIKNKTLSILHTNIFLFEGNAEKKLKH